MPLDKRYFVDQLRRHFQQSLEVAQRAELDAREAARTVATESEKKEDGRIALEFGSLATGQAVRTRQAREELEELESFCRRELPRFNRETPIALGAIVDLATDEEDGGERTFILLPVGAGTELTGPGGDGFLSVITPASPIGKALLGRRAGDSIDVRIKGEWREWTIVDLS